MPSCPIGDGPAQTVEQRRGLLQRRLPGLLEQEDGAQAWTIDHLGQDPRFEVAYELYSTTYNVYLRVKSSTGEDEADFPSAVAIWPAANWHEREAYDMMGVRFTGHPDLRRILMWEGYPYFPLRKEFPLAGKDSDLPEVAFSKPAPLQGGPFVTAPGAGDTVEREPRARGLE